MVSLKVNFQKKDLWLLSAIVVFLVGVGFVIAWNSGNPAIHGHTADEIYGLDGSGGGSLACNIKTCSGSPDIGCNATCDSGYTVTGGGYSISVVNDKQPYKSYPSANNKWYCADPSNSVTCYAVCCKGSGLISETLNCIDTGRALAIGQSGNQVCSVYGETCVGVFTASGGSAFTCSWVATNANYFANCCRIV